MREQSAQEKSFDVAVVISSKFRKSLLRAVRSVFMQDFAGRIQVLIGFDLPLGDPAQLDLLHAECPPHIKLTIVVLGYSTSRRHGGIYSNSYGGALPTILTYAANSKFVAYLDDDDWYGRDHLSSLLSAIAGKHWAFSYRWLFDDQTGWAICRDEWDSVGPGRGINKDRFGGFACPSTLMVDKEACHFILPLWSIAAFADGSGSDRHVLKELFKHPWGASGMYSCHFEMTQRNINDNHHVREFLARNIQWTINRSLILEVERLAAVALECFERHAIDDTVAGCRKVLAINPYHAESLHLLGLAEGEAESMDAAAGHLREAIAIDDRRGVYVSSLASILDRKGDADEAASVRSLMQRRLFLDQ